MMMMMTKRVQEIVIDDSDEKVMAVVVDFVEIRWSMPVSWVPSKANEEKRGREGIY